MSFRISTIDSAADVFESAPPAKTAKTELANHHFYVRVQAEAVQRQLQESRPEIYSRASLIAAAMTGRFLRGCRANNSTRDRIEGFQQSQALPKALPRLSISTGGGTQITGAIYSVCTNFKLVGWFQGNDTNVILVCARYATSREPRTWPPPQKALGRCRGVLFGPPHWLDCGWGDVGTASTRTPKHRRSLREAVAIRRRPRATITSLNFGQRVVGRQR